MIKSLRILVLALAIIGSLPSAAWAGSVDEAYFRQFLYRVDEDLSDPDFPVYTYYYVMSDYDHEIATSPKEYMTVWVSLYLLPDKTYKMVYKENHHVRGEDQFFPGACKVLTGEWDVPDKNLEIKFEGKVIAEGARHFENGQHHIMMNFKSKIVSPHLVGQKIAHGMGQSNIPLNDARCFPF